MQFSHATLAAVLVSLVSAQSIADVTAMIPSCALTCLVTGISAAGCDATDYSCQCGSGKDAITKSATPCIAGACSSAETLEVLNLTTQICSIQAASGSSGSSSAASSAVESVTSAASSVASSVASSASETSAAASSAVSSVSSAATSAASSAAESGTDTTATSSAPIVESTTNAGSKLNAAGAIAGAAVLAAFAL